MTSALTYRGPAVAVLHEEYAKRHRVDRDAPARAEADVVIDATVPTVWAKLTDLNAWATNLERGVRGIRIPHGVTVDEEFQRSAKGARMRARFAVVDPQRELAWTGTSLGVRVVHRFTLEPVEGTRTRVVAEKSMAGWLAALFASEKLAGLLRQSLDTLKQACESVP
jgi:hypothetical protein